MAGSSTYYLVCDEPGSLFLSHCFALLRSCSYGLRSLKTAAVPSSSKLPLALPSAFDDGLFWGFGVFGVGFAAVLVGADTAQMHVCTIFFQHPQAVAVFTDRIQGSQHFIHSLNHSHFPVGGSRV